MVNHKVADLFPAGWVHVERIIKQVANEYKLLQACCSNYLDELFRCVRSILKLLVLQTKICNFTLDLSSGLQVIVFLEIEADNIGLVKTDFTVNKFDCVLIIRVRFSRLYIIISLQPI